MAKTTIGQQAGNIATEYSALFVLAALIKGMQNRVLTDPGLRIKGGSGSALAQAHTATYAKVNDVLVTKAADTDMPAVAGTVANGEYGIYLWTINSSGTLAQQTLADAATLAGIVFPNIPTDEAVVGAMLIHPTGAGDFVGGTTDLDDATVVPNAVFFDGNDFAGLVNVLSFRETGLPGLVTD